MYEQGFWFAIICLGGIILNSGVWCEKYKLLITAIGFFILVFAAMEYGSLSNQ